MLLLLLSRFSLVRLCATLRTAAHQAPLSTGFSRQEYWSGLPFPSPNHTCVLSRFSRVQLWATLRTAPHQAPRSTGFSRQEPWSGLPFPSPNRNEVQLMLWVYEVSPPPLIFALYGDFPVAQTVKNLLAMQETQVWFLGREDPLEKGMPTHSSILAWSIPWTEEPVWLQSVGSQTVRHDWATNALTHLPPLNFLPCTNKANKIISIYSFILLVGSNMKQRN